MHQLYIPRDPSMGLPRRPHDVRYWMDIHARYPSNMSDLYHDNCSQVTYTEWWADPNRDTYVIDDPCVVFDAYWRPFTDLVLKNWFGVPCQNGHYFICIKLMDGMSSHTNMFGVFFDDFFFTWYQVFAMKMTKHMYTLHNYYHNHIYYLWRFHYHWWSIIIILIYKSMIWL